MEMKVTFSNCQFVMQADSASAEFRAAGGSKSETRPTPGVECDPIATTCFTEAEGTAVSSYSSKSMVNNYQQMYDTIKSFLMRPQLVTATHYSTASMVNTEIWSADVISLLTSNAVWMDKIKGFNLFRGNLHVRVEVNASPFQAGMLLLHYIPGGSDHQSLINTANEALWNKTLNAKFQHPRVEVDISRTMAEIVVPWITPAPFYALKEGGFNPGSVNLSVVTPFRTGASGLTYVEVVVYAYWTDVELAAPCVPQADDSFVLQADKELKLSRVKKKPKMGVSDEYASGPVESSLTLLGAAADSLGSIPSLSAFTGPVSWAAKVGAGIAGFFGWSKEVDTENVSTIMRHQGRYDAVMDGTDNSVPMSLTATNRLRMDDRYSVTDADEMSLGYLLSVPSYVTQFSWATGVPSGVNLYNWTACPYLASEQTDTTIGVFDYSYRQGAPCFYLGNLFRYWRGSFKVRLKFVKTRFHSGRLQLTWTPISTVPTSPDTSTSIYSLRQIVDIREQEEVELVLPYMVNANYLQTAFNSGAGTNQLIGFSSGLFDVVVLNDLRCPETVNSSIDIIVVVTPGEDFEFQAPTCQQYGISNADDSTQIGFYSGSCFVPQADTAEMLVSSGIADTAIKNVSTMYSEQHFGEHVTSIRQLLQRFTTFGVDFVAGSDTAVTVFPWFMSAYSADAIDGHLVSAASGGDMLSYLAPMYKFFRGGVRLKVVSSDGVGTISMTNTPGLFKTRTLLSATAPTYSNSGAPNFYRTPLAGGNLGENYLTGITTTDPTVTVANVRIPYYCQYPVSQMQVWDGYHDKLPYTEPTLPDSAVTLWSQGSFASQDKMWWQRSITDDFQLHFFVAAPPIIVNYTPH